MNILIGIVLIWGSLQSYVICDCGCKEYFDPVCGTDDRDYPNMCELHCESLNCRSRGQSEIVLAYGGPCVCDCSGCPTRYQPVCGSDGRTYWNSCWLSCYDSCNKRREQPRISQTGTGYCCPELQK